VWRVMNNGRPVEGTYNKLQKAQKEAKKFWLRNNPDEDYFELGFEQKWGSTYSLWVDDGSAAYHTGIVVEKA
jgi:hypothetical protein